MILQTKQKQIRKFGEVEGTESWNGGACRSLFAEVHFPVEREPEALRVLRLWFAEEMRSVCLVLPLPVEEFGCDGKERVTAGVQRCLYRVLYDTDDKTYCHGLHGNICGYSE